MVAGDYQKLGSRLARRVDGVGGDTGERIAQVREGVNTVLLASSDQAKKDGSGLAWSSMSYRIADMRHRLRADSRVRMAGLVKYRRACAQQATSVTVTPIVTDRKRMRR